MTAAIIPAKAALFAAELEQAYTALVEKYWEDGLEFFDIDLKVYTHGEVFFKFWEEGIEFYPEEDK